MKALFQSAKEAVDTSNQYTQKIQIPQYEPSNVKPNIAELCNYTKYSELIHGINNSHVTEDEKKFLKYAAARHLVFNYSKVADYYAHASKEMQELMEDSALVVLDIDDAIAKGYVQLSKHIEEIMERPSDA